MCENSIEKLYWVGNIKKQQNKMLPNGQRGQQTLLTTI